MLVLGVETSCDETAAAVVDEQFAVHSNIIWSQEDHALYGGVVPELASRAHIRYLVPVVAKALEDAGVDWRAIDGIATTRGPGLVGSLIVGLSLAKGLALAQKKPLVGVHHLEGHIFSNLVEDRVETPFLTLLVSGGHTELILVEALGTYKMLGRTRDDAAGEAFDKVAKLLDLLPKEGVIMGGRIIAELAAQDDPQAIDFPRGLAGEPDLIRIDLPCISTRNRILNHLIRFCNPFRKSFFVWGRRMVSVYPEGRLDCYSIRQRNGLDQIMTNHATLKSGNILQC